MTLSEVQKFESRGHTTHIAWDGLEIQREFYVEPFFTAPDVVEALQGSVRQDNKKVWTRRLPAIDPYYDFCFCNEARSNHIDSEKESIAVSPALGFVPPAVDRPAGFYERFMHAVNTVQDRPAGGAFVTASYRPLISSLVPTITPDMTEAKKNEARSPMFDWMDPQFTPTVHTIPWTTGFSVGTDRARFVRGEIRVPDDVGKPLSIVVVEFSIRRMLVGEPPWNLIDTHANTVNNADFPAGITHTLPTFKKGTLRFENMDVIEHYSSTAPGHLWFEIIYHFSWIKHKAEQNVYDEKGKLDNSSIVTWNHLLMNLSGDFSHRIDRGLQWRFVNRLAPGSWFLDFDKQIGPLYSFNDFMPLFKL